MENEYTLKRCAECGGKCCKNLPGIYSPEDLFGDKKDITKEDIMKVLDQGGISIDRWEADKESNYKDMYFLRPQIDYRESGDQLRVVDYALFPLDSCIHLTDKGCDLEHDKRPFGCRNLVPVQDEGYCTDIWANVEQELNRLRYAGLWNPYNDILEEIACSDEYEYNEPLYILKALFCVIDRINTK